MTTNNPSEQIRGRTIRFSWTDGPTKGSTHEHVFHQDGTVEWRSVDSGRAQQGADQGKGGGETGKSAERPKYSSVEVIDDVWLVSYLAQSGYTLTVALKFEDGSMVGVASNEKSWFPVRGRFQVIA